MSLPPLFDRLRLPAIGAPLFIVSNPDLVIAQCKAGIVGSFPALNARPQSLLDEWLHRITEELAAWDRDHPDAPVRALCGQPDRPPLQRPADGGHGDLRRNGRCRSSSPRWARSSRSTRRVHGWGGITLHDIINDRFARKAVEKGADGIIAVAAGAGGHAGRLSPFALVQEIRDWFDGPLILSGAIATGRAILAAQAMGADLGYIGSPFIATAEANADRGLQAGHLRRAAPTTSSIRACSPACTAIICRKSIELAGLDPANLPEGDIKTMDFGTGDGSKAKAWRDIWGSGQGIGAIDCVRPAGDYVARLIAEYAEAKAELLREIDPPARAGRIARPPSSDAAGRAARRSAPRSAPRPCGDCRRRTRG